jgi:hypothetical protein
MNDIIVIDDIIPLIYQNKIIEELENPTIGWNFTESTVYHNDEPLRVKHNNGNIKGDLFFIDENTVDSCQLTFLMKSPSSMHIDPIANFFFPLIYNALEKANVGGSIVRLKANMLLYNKDMSKDKYNHVHVDGDLPHYVVLYYVNDSDGDTFIFNETYKSLYDKLTIKQRVSPKKGRVIVFDGKYMHASSNPINCDKRIVINCDVLK